MARHVDSAQSIQTHVSIDLRGADRGVTQQILHYAQIRTTFEKVSGKRVSQRMRCDRFGNSSQSSVLQHDSVH